MMRILSFLSDTAVQKKFICESSNSNIVVFVESIKSDLDGGLRALWFLNGGFTRNICMHYKFSPLKNH